MDFLKVSVVVLFVVLTIITIRIHPEIHQPMVIEDADFKLVRVSDTITSQTTPVTTVGPTVTQQTVTVEPQQTKQVQQSVNIATPKATETPKYVQVETPQQTRPIKIKLPKKDTQAQTVVQEPSQNELLRRLLNTDIEDTKALEENSRKLAQSMQKNNRAPQQTYKQPQQTSTHKNPYMTEQEEIIAWSRWRSNIHNQVMKDSNAGVAPYGTVFSFSFLVDKYGNVSNVKVSCSNNYCMNIARDNLKPAIMHLQRKPILNFPRGTQRTSTVVSGSFLIGSEDKFSTPSNFSDFERVVH